MIRMRHALAPILTACLLSCAASVPPPTPRPLQPYGTRSVVYARNGMVASSHPLATRVGVEILLRGGSAVDAAIAVNAMLGMIEPMMCGIGGDLFAQVWDAKTRKLYGLNASGRCPQGLTADKVPPTSQGTVPPYSPFAWTVPGAVDGWFALHGKFGRLPMKDLLGPAIRAGNEGVPVPRVISGEWRGRGGPGFASVFLPQGRPPAEGEIFRNPALARTYGVLAEGGRDAFYRGSIAETILAFSRKQGGFFSKKDFADNKPTWVEPISTTYRGVRVHQIPPNGQGLAALQMLNILETFDLRKMGRDSADFWHVMIESKKLAFEDRAAYYGDPTQTEIPVEKLLSKEYAKKRAAEIRMERAADRVNPGLQAGDTTYLAVGDKDGNMISLIQSIYHGGGSGYVPDGLGFCLQNRGAGFSLNPNHPNFLKPGKRPFHTIIPGFVTKDGTPLIAYGVMGGDVQPQGHVQVIVNLVDFGMDLQEAGDAPRYRHAGSSEPSGTKLWPGGGDVYLESAAGPEIRVELLRRGHQMKPGGWYGGYQAVMRDPRTGILAGATESRKDGCALGY